MPTVARTSRTPSPSRREPTERSTAASIRAGNEQPGGVTRVSGAADLDLHRNEVVLVGRLSAVDPVRELPSGDEVVAFRVVVRRAAGRRAGASVDVIDCHAVTAKVRRALLAVPVDATVEVTGALRRRFFRAGGALASRYDVEATAVRRARR